MAKSIALPEENFLVISLHRQRWPGLSPLIPCVTRAMRIFSCHGLIALAAFAAQTLVAAQPPSPPTGNSSAITDQTIQVAGSDLLQTAVGEPLARYARQNGLNAKVDLYGTVPALVLLKDNKAQLGIIAVPPGQKPPAGYTIVEYCFQVAYILVNPENPLNEVDRTQLVGFFGTGTEKEITSWGDAGLSGIWSGRTVIPVTTSADDGVVLELFKNTILGQATLKPGVRILKTATDVAKTLAGSNTVIALSGYVPETEAKALLVSMEARVSGAVPAAATGGKGAYAPTEDNVYSGVYPLRLPFYLAFKPENKERLREVLRVLLSNEFAQHLRDQHLVPVPETERKKSLLGLDIPADTGTITPPAAP
jgi:phosphate transport system substrate-binding protein